MVDGSQSLGEKVVRLAKTPAGMICGLLMMPVMLIFFPVVVLIVFLVGPIGIWVGFHSKQVYLFYTDQVHLIK